MPPRRQAQFIRVSGWGFVLGGLMLLLTFLSAAQIEFLQRVFGTSTPSAGMRFLAAIILITLGLLGLGMRYAEKAGLAAKLALGIGVAGGLASVVGNLLWTLQYENGRTFMNQAMAVMFAGLLAFGLVALRVRPMPRGNGLPALAGGWWPSIVIGSQLYHQITGQWLNVSFWPGLALFLGMSLSLAWLGYALQADVPAQTKLESHPHA